MRLPSHKLCDILNFNIKKFSLLLKKPLFMKRVRIMLMAICLVAVVGGISF